MDIKAIFKSLALGSLLALAAIIIEFRFFYADDITEMHPGAGGLFFLRLLIFFGIVLLLSMQFRLMSGVIPRKFNAEILLQIIFLALYFLLIIINPLLLYGLTMVNGAFAVIGVVLYFWKRDKTYLLQAGAYLLMVCLCLLLLTTTYWVEA